MRVELLMSMQFSALKIGTCLQVQGMKALLNFGIDVSSQMNQNLLGASSVTKKE